MASTSPTLRSLKTQLAQAQLERELLESQLAVAALKRVARPLTEAWGELVDPLEWLNDVPGFYGPGARGQYPYSQIQDREGGKDGPIILTEQDLSQIRGTARVLTEAVPSAIGALTNLTNYIIGTGLTYKAAAVVKREDKELVAAVQAIVDQFLEANDWTGDQEREIFWRTRRDGEAFVDFTDMEGDVQLRIIEPEQVTEPKELPDYGRCWTFGIDTDADDVQSVGGYHVQWNALDPLDYREADRVDHIKLNTDRNVKRGLSDFYPVHKHFTDADKLNRNMRQGAAILSAIAMIREHATGVTQAQAESMRSGAAYQMYNQPTVNMGTKSGHIQKIEPGTIHDVPKGQVYKGSPLGEGTAAANFVAIEQAVLRMAGIRWSMPQYLVSGDASNANYSSTMVAESPWTKFCEATQTFYCKRFARIVWKALRMMEAAGRFRRLVGSFSELRARVQLLVTGPRIAVRDATAETNRLKTLSDMGIVADSTIAAEEGYDLDEERAEGAAKAQVSPAVQPTVSAIDSQTQKPSGSQDSTLNGAQISAAKDVLISVTARQMGTVAAIGLLVAVGIDPTLAKRMVDSAISIPSVKVQTPDTPVGQQPVTKSAIESTRERIAAAANLLWEGYPGGARPKSEDKKPIDNA